MACTISTAGVPRPCQAACSRPTACFATLQKPLLVCARPQPRASVVVAARRRSRCRGLRVAAAAGSATTSDASVQLATAKLPADVNREKFADALYQWAATLTTNGRNLPFALPQRVDKRGDGFQISLLRVADGGVVSVADLVASVESVQGAGDVLIVRLYQGEGAAQLGMAGPASAAPQERLETLLSGLVDVPIIMTTMADAIRRAVMVSR